MRLFGTPSSRRCIHYPLEIREGGRLAAADGDEHSHTASYISCYLVAPKHFVGGVGECTASPQQRLEPVSEHARDVFSSDHISLSWCGEID